MTDTIESHLLALAEKASAADFGALANSVHMSNGPDNPIFIGGRALSITTGKVEAELLAAKEIWYHLASLCRVVEAARACHSFGSPGTCTVYDALRALDG